MDAFSKTIIWWIVSTIIELIAAFIVAALLVLFFNLAGIAALSSLSYWNLYWIQMAVYSSVGSAVVMGIQTVAFMED